jgi:RNA polymerase sigma factor (sigma-70 family)
VSGVRAPELPSGLVVGAAHDADGVLAARLVAGDDSALAEVYDQYGSLVYGIALQLLCDSAAAADVAQDVFVQLWRQPERYDPARGSLRTWLATIARRRAVDQLRTGTRRVRREERVAAQRVTSPPDVEEAATALVRGERVRKALRELPPEQRQAVELAYYQGLSYREVAQALGIPEGTAKSRLRLALNRLATALREEGPMSWT